jgi:hypothetical protein
MTDQAMAGVLDDLERILAMPLEFPDPKVIADWHESFKRCAASAERGPGWPGLVERAHQLGRLLKRREALLRADQQRVRRELNKFSVSRRALSAYQAVLK